MDVLSGGSDDLNVRGCHPTVFPVQLPSWLPRNIMENMVAKFENRLLQEITSMKHEPRTAKGSHSRHPSKQSISGLSIASDDSDSSVEIGFPQVQ